MALRTTSEIKGAEAYTPFGTHTFTPSGDDKKPEIRSAHYVRAYEGKHPGDDPNVMPSNQLSNIITYRIFHGLINRKPYSFLNNPYEKLQNFDSKYDNVSFAVHGSNGNYNYTSILLGGSNDKKDHVYKKTDDYLILNFVIDGKTFDKKRISDVRKIKSEKIHYVNINAGDYIVIAVKNNSNDGICKQLTLLYKVEEFTTIPFNHTFEESKKSVQLEYSVANCSLATVSASNIDDGIVTMVEDSYIVSKNSKKFETQVMDYINSTFEKILSPTESLEFGKNMYVIPVQYKSEIDRWTLGAFEAINILKHFGGPKQEIYKNKDGDLNATEEQMKEKIEEVPIEEENPQFNYTPIICFVKSYINDQIGSLRIESNENMKQDKKILLMKNYILNHKATVMVDAESDEDSKITITLSFPSIYAGNIGYLKFDFDPIIHMSEQYSDVFYKNICKKIVDDDGNVNYELMEPSTTVSHYVSILIDYNCMSES